MHDFAARLDRWTPFTKAGIAGAPRSPFASMLAAFDCVPNPGALVARKYVPTDLAPGAPLVVVLHGCTQDAEGYDRGTGWTALAGLQRFAVLYPEQRRANNVNGCFNWFEPGDTQRGAGEPASIKAMIDTMIADHGIDPARIFITGLSAGAAMAGVMLATYPEVFAGGGLIAGLPYGVARSMPAALSRMRSRGHESDAQLADLVRSASTHDGPWPTVSIWHGTADATVHVANAEATVAQWRGVHDLATQAATEETLPGGHHRRRWHDGSGRVVVEEYAIARMGHGTPLDVGATGTTEQAGAFLLDVGVSSTLRLAAAWNIAPLAADALPVVHEPTTRPTMRPAATIADGSGVQKIIEDALRSAGLMR